MEKKEIIYSEEFISALEYCKENKLYLGEGNPNAKILIIGKECALSESEDSVAVRNLNSWDNIIKDLPQLYDFEEFKNQHKEGASTEFYPLYPWIGQKFETRRLKKDGSGYLGDQGTSTTWYNYQKLVDAIFKESAKNKEDFIDFHVNCFHSELSQLPMRTSKKGIDNLRKESIKKREKLFEHTFFQKFTIIVLACAHYPRDYFFDIQKTFAVDYKKDLSSEWCNIHHQKEGEPRLVIHTRQFSNGISNELIEKIAEECRSFLQDNNIVL